MTTAPDTVEALRERILASYDDLSKRMKQVGRYVLDQPDDLAFETLAVVSHRSGVQPSAIVRFAKSFGFSGAHQMQKLIREDLLSNHVNLAYGERVRQFNRNVGRSSEGGIDILREHAEADILALGNLKDTFPAEAFERAVEALQEAACIYVVAARRTFPIAAYLAYSLQQLGKKTVFIDGAGGFYAQSAGTIEPDDLLLAISYHSYSEDTVRCAQIASERGANVLAITDSSLSPLARFASNVLVVRESEVRNFRSLASSMSLAQSLILAHAFRVSGDSSDDPLTN